MAPPIVVIIGEDPILSGILGFLGLRIAECSILLLDDLEVYRLFYWQRWVL